VVLRSDLPGALVSAHLWLGAGRGPGANGPRCGSAQMFLRDGYGALLDAGAVEVPELRSDALEKCL
jgi:hypothetical protein